jgi:hypothetical protein
MVLGSEEFIAPYINKVYTLQMDGGVYNVSISQEPLCTCLDWTLWSRMICNMDFVHVSIWIGYTTLTFATITNILFIKELWQSPSGQNLE